MIRHRDSLDIACYKMHRTGWRQSSPKSLLGTMDKWTTRSDEEVGVAPVMPIRKQSVSLSTLPVSKRKPCKVMYSSKFNIVDPSDVHFCVTLTPSVITVERNQKRKKSKTRRSEEMSTLTNKGMKGKTHLNNEKTAKTKNSSSRKDLTRSVSDSSLKTASSRKSRNRKTDKQVSNSIHGTSRPSSQRVKSNGETFHWWNLSPTPPNSCERPNGCKRTPKNELIIEPMLSLAESFPGLRSRPTIKHVIGAKLKEKSKKTTRKRERIRASETEKALPTTDHSTKDTVTAEVDSSIVHEQNFVETSDLSCGKYQTSRGSVKQNPIWTYSTEIMDHMTNDSLLSAVEGDFECTSSEDNSSTHRDKHGCLPPQIKTPPDVNECAIFDLNAMKHSSNDQVSHYLQQLMKKCVDKAAKMTERKVKQFIVDLYKRNWSSIADGVQANEGVSSGDLDVSEVFDLVAYINLCEQTNTPIRWDLIHDVVSSYSLKTDGFGQKMKSGRAIKSRELISKVTDDSLCKSEYIESGSTIQTVEDHVDVEVFRNQNHLSHQEMQDIIVHLKLCEETGKDVRWDLIHQIIHPGDTFEFGLPPNRWITSTDASVGRSVLTDNIDNESYVSWFSIDPELDDCASSVTFLVDCDDFTMGRKSIQS
jgi:hypothetical protein